MARLPLAVRLEATSASPVPGSRHRAYAPRPARGPCIARGDRHPMRGSSRRLHPTLSGVRLPIGRLTHLWVHCVPLRGGVPQRHRPAPPLQAEIRGVHVPGNQRVFRDVRQARPPTRLFPLPLATDPPFMLLSGSATLIGPSQLRGTAPTRGAGKAQPCLRGLALPPTRGRHPARVGVG